MFKRKHWSVKAHESLVCRNHDGHFCLIVEGGAEGGLFPFVGELRQDRIHYQSGKLYHGEILLEVNHRRVPGMIKKDVMALIKRSADPVSLVTVKQNATITKDIRQYLGTRFSKGSVDSELQHQIRKNLHMRAVPCTTREMQKEEKQGVDYNFISVEEFKEMERNGDFVEIGIYDGNYHGIAKPLPDPSSPKMPKSLPDSSSPKMPKSLPDLSSEMPKSLPDLSSEMPKPRPDLSSKMPKPRPDLSSPKMPKLLGPLPANWEIAYTENEEKFFIDHNTGTTHWLDPRLVRYFEHNVMECEETELPYGWERVDDPMYGVYFVDHINRVTQYDNPVVDAKHKYAGSQLPQCTGLPSYSEHGPPSIKNMTVKEKLREAKAAMMWPDAGLHDFQDESNPYPYQQPSEQDLEAKLQGNVIQVMLTKTAQGFGFTIIGGDYPGELLQIDCIVRGSAVDRDGSLKVGDVLVRINGISVLGYSHRKVVELFRSLPLNCEVNIEVRRDLPDYPYQDFSRDYQKTGPHSASFRPPPSPLMAMRSMRGSPSTLSRSTSTLGSSWDSLSRYSYSVSDDYAASQYGMHESFSTSEIRLLCQVSGFGFRIIGGKEEGSQVTVGAIVAGGAADLDGRLQIGDEIAYINGRSVLDASHHDVLGLMGTASAQGELVLSIQRMMPMPEYLRSEPLLDSSHLSAPTGIRVVVIDRPNLQTAFGFVLQSNILHAGVIICRLIPDSPASKCQQLYMYDEVLAVNGQDVSTMDHGDIVTLIKSSGTTIRLTVQQPEDPKLVERQQLYHGQEPPLGQLYRSPDQGDGRRQFQDFDHGYQYDKEVGSPISTDVEDIGSDDEEIQHIDIDRDERRFGFSIRGGAEYNAPLRVLRIADHGAAMNDGRLRVGDELLEINGNPTEGMLHLDAITIVKHGGDRVGLIVKRVNEQDESVLQGHHIGVDMDIIAEKTFVIGSDACILNFKGCGVKLHIPQNSLPADCQQCELKIRASLSGNFKLPSNCELVSGVYCIQCPVKFTKDVTLEVQHCCTQTEKLTFIQAESTKKAPNLCLFQILKGGKFPEGSTHGSIELSAFSYIGIVWERITEWLFPPRLYKANMYRSFTDKNNTWILYFTIIKELELEEKDFPKVLEKDVMRKIHDVVIQTFPIKFNDDRIELDNLNCNDHWQLTTELHPVIFQETVDKYKGQAGGIIPYIRINVKFSGGETESTLSRTIILRGVPEHHAHRSFLLTLECNEPITYHSVPPVLLPSRPSLEECISSTGIDRVLLDEQVTDTTLTADIADKFTQWRAMCPFLGIKESEKEVIEAAGDLSEQRRKLLTMWTQKYGPRATYRHLCTILWEHSRIDLVEAICEMVKSQLQ